MKIELTKNEWALIIIALKAMEETYEFIRGFGKVGREQKRFEDLIEKIKTNHPTK